MSNQKKIIISLTEYVGLLNDSEYLNCLRGAGVDNWCGINQVEYPEEMTEKDFENDSRIVK